MTTTELKQLVDGIRFIEKAKAHPIDKDQLAESMTDLKRMFGKSLVAARALNAGTKLTEADVALKKPGTGIPAAKLKDTLGRKLKRAVAADALLAEDDLA